MSPVKAMKNSLNPMKINHRYTLSLLALASLPWLGGCSSQNFSSGLDTSKLSSVSGLNQVTGAEDYRIGAADLLDVKVFQADELSRAVRVDAHGNITLPLVGKIPVAGLTQSEAEQKLASIMQQNLLQNPQVTVFIKEYTSQRVTLEGEFKKPGVYPIAGQTTVLQAIAMAAGPSDLAATDKAVLFRRQGAQSKAYLVDLNAIRNGQIPDPYVRNDDRIVMHRSNSRFWVREAASILSPIATINSLVN